jgi:hypothetical protein
MKDNYSKWKKALRDFRFIDLVMILILIFAIAVCCYVHRMG